MAILVQIIPIQTYVKYYLYFHRKYCQIIYRVSIEKACAWLIRAYSLLVAPPAQAPSLAVEEEMRLCLFSDPPNIERIFNS